MELLPKGGVVGISGYGGSGKTTLAREIAYDVPGIQLVHVDDYLDWPVICQRNTNGDGIEFDHIVEAHIEPLRNGRKPVDYVFVEGIYLFRHDRQATFDLRIWVDSPLEESADLGHARDAGNQHLWESVWVPNERDFAERFSPTQYADLFYDWRGANSPE